MIRVMLAASLLALAFCCAPALASDIVEVRPLTDRIIMVHFDDGYVIHSKDGQPRSDDKVITDPLDTAAAQKTDSYTINSTDDAAYAKGSHPADVGRKTKGTDFAWFVDKWEDGHAVNKRPDHTDEHWLYLMLPAPLQHGKTYTVDTGKLAANGHLWKFTFDEAKERSEAVHVNLLGYVPDAPAKYAYVYHWMGDRGSMDVKAYDGHAFQLIDQANGRAVFSGKLVFRMPATNPETGQLDDSPPHGNFLNADVSECDFSAFNTPGTYVVAVDGIGCSFPFHISADVYRPAFDTVMKGIYHQRSGIALTAPYTDFPRPAPHNPKLTPGFAGKLKYTSVRFTEWGSEGGDAKVLQAGIKGDIDACHWYQDAGDWDSYYTHLRVAQELLFAYEMAPENFRDGGLNIPESGNGVPDILDEAAWLPRFCYTLRHELLKKGYGTGGIGLRIAGDAFGGDEKTLPDGKKVGQGSWQDVDRLWVASGEDPWSTYRYAGAAAHLAYCLKLAQVKDAAGVDWATEAREAYQWAQANTRPGDEKKGPSLSAARAYAAAALFVITGEPSYEQQFAKDTNAITATTEIREDQAYGPLVYLLSTPEKPRDTKLEARLRSAILATADDDFIHTPARRALRWGGNFYMPMLIGQQTTPWALNGAAAYVLTRQSDPDKARQYRAALYTTCDYFLGTNALNQTWVTGLGVRHPTQVFDLDAWYNGKDTPHPGIIPYGPWRKQKDVAAGPWDADWPNKTVYPGIDQWPGNERWYNNRCSPMNSEFTIHQNQAPAAMIFGFLCGPAQPANSAH